MIAAIIRWSVANRLLVVLAALALAVAGAIAVRTTGRRVARSPMCRWSSALLIRPAPQMVEDRSRIFDHDDAYVCARRGRTVRGYSFFGDSFVYAAFRGFRTDLIGRSRVLEYLLGANPAAADGARIVKPDATGVGWVFQAWC
ncbi:MAG: hypothetical protein R3C31_10385 [Hyphomonadaceae bacterium]